MLNAPEGGPRLPAHSAFGFASPPVAAPPGLEITVGGHTPPPHLDAHPTTQIRAGCAGPDAASQSAAKRKNAITQQTMCITMTHIYVNQGLHDPKPHQGIFYQEQGCTRAKSLVSSRPH